MMIFTWTVARIHNICTDSILRYAVYEE